MVILGSFIVETVSSDKLTTRFVNEKLILDEEKGETCAVTIADIDI